MPGYPETRKGGIYRVTSKVLKSGIRGSLSPEAKTTTSVSQRLSKHHRSPLDKPIVRQDPGCCGLKSFLEVKKISEKRGPWFDPELCAEWPGFAVIMSHFPIRERKLTTGLTRSDVNPQTHRRLEKERDKKCVIVTTSPPVYLDSPTASYPLHHHSISVSCNNISVVSSALASANTLRQRFLSYNTPPSTQRSA